jgi:hypothetical protein
MESAGEGIWMYLDNSNTWIEAKRFFGNRLNNYFKEDPRVRINPAKLAEVVIDGRKVEGSILYGSGLPQIYTLFIVVKLICLKFYILFSISVKM